MVFEHTLLLLIIDVYEDIHKIDLSNSVAVSAEADALAENAKHVKVYAIQEAATQVIQAQF